MAAFKRFEDITAWQKARELSAAIYIAPSDGAFSRDFELRNQIRTIRSFDNGEYCRGFWPQDEQRFC